MGKMATGTKWRRNGEMRNDREKWDIKRNEREKLSRKRNEREKWKKTKQNRDIGRR